MRDARQRRLRHPLHVRTGLLLHLGPVQRTQLRHLQPGAAAGPGDGPRHERLRPVLLLRRLPARQVAAQRPGPLLQLPQHLRRAARARHDHQRITVLRPGGGPRLDQGLEERVAQLAVGVVQQHQAAQGAGAVAAVPGVRALEIGEERLEQHRLGAFPLGRRAVPEVLVQLDEGVRRDLGPGAAARYPAEPPVHAPPHPGPLPPLYQRHDRRRPPGQPHRHTDRRHQVPEHRQRMVLRAAGPQRLAHLAERGVPALRVGLGGQRHQQDGEGRQGQRREVRPAGVELEGDTGQHVDGVVHPVVERREVQRGHRRPAAPGLQPSRERGLAAAARPEQQQGRVPGVFTVCADEPLTDELPDHQITSGLHRAPSWPPS